MFIKAKGVCGRRSNVDGIYMSNTNLRGSKIIVLVRCYFVVRNLDEY